MNRITSLIHILFRTLFIPVILVVCITSCSDDEGGEETPAVTITAVTPATARVGENIMIAGKGFREKRSQNNVSFKTAGGGTVDAKVITATATSLTVTVPEGAYNGAITVTVDGKSTISDESFTIDTSPGLPTLTTIEPTHALPNVEVTIKGTNFGADKSVVKVLFGTTEATEIVTVTNTTINVKVPVSLKLGEVDVKVKREAMESLGSLKFTVDKNPAAVKASYWASSGDIYRGTISEESGAVITKIYDGDLVLDDIHGIEVDEGGEFVYWVQTNKVMRAPLAENSTAETLYETSGDQGELSFVTDLAIDPASGMLYVVGGFFFTPTYDPGDVYILTGRMDGSTPLQRLYTIANSWESSVSSLKLNESRLYWIEQTSKGVFVADVGGAAQPALLYDGGDNLTYPQGIALDNHGNLYIANQSFIEGIPHSSILKGKADGSGSLTPIVKSETTPTLWSPKDMEVDTENGYLFWLDQKAENNSITYGIWRFRLDGAGVQNVFDSLPLSSYIDLGTE